MSQPNLRGGLCWDLRGIITESLVKELFSVYLSFGGISRSRLYFRPSSLVIFGLSMYRRRLFFSKISMFLFRSSFTSYLDLCIEFWSIYTPSLYIFSEWYCSFDVLGITRCSFSLKSLSLDSFSLYYFTDYSYWYLLLVFWSSRGCLYYLIAFLLYSGTWISRRWLHTSLLDSFSEAIALFIL